MQEFIAMAARQLGVDSSVTEKATSSLLGYVRKAAESGDAKALLAALPGNASELAAAGPKAAAGQGGGLGGLVRGLATSFGGKKGASLADAAGLAGQLKAAGLDLGQLAPFATLFAGFARQHAGDDLFERVLGQVPQLRQLLG